MSTRRFVTTPIPQSKLFGTVVQRFDGTIDGNLLKDISGNGYDLDIINNDITMSGKGIPYKTASLFAQKIENQAFIPDLTGFWFSGSTPNQLPIISFYQDIDYTHQTFCRHISQILDSNGVEIVEPRVIEIVTYSEPLSGDALTRAQSYFNVPPINPTARWIDYTRGDDTNTGTQQSPYKTTSKLYNISWSGMSYAISSTYLPSTAGGGSILLPQKDTFEMTAVGYCVLKSTTGQTYTVRSYNNNTIRGFVIDGSNSISPSYAYRIEISGKSPTLDKCYIVNSKSPLQNTLNTSGITFTNSIIVVSASTTYSCNFASNSQFHTNTIDTCYFGGSSLTSLTTIYARHTIIKNSKFRSYSPGTPYQIFLQPSGGTSNFSFPCTIIGNDVYNYYNGIVIDGSDSLSGDTHNVSFNTVSAAAGVLYYNIYLFNSKAIHVIKNNIVNQIYSSWSNNSGTTSIYSQSKSPSFIENNIITDDHLWEARGIIIPFIDLTYDSLIGACSIKNNLIHYINANGGYGIMLGGENNSLYNLFEGSEVSGNKLITDATSYGGLHGILIGWGDNVITKYNTVINSHIGLVVKNHSRSYTSGGVGYNLFIDCRYSMFAKGTGALYFYNNTCYTTKNISGLIMIMLQTDIGGLDQTSGVTFINNILRPCSAATYLYIYDTGCTYNTLQNSVIFDPSQPTSKAVYDYPSLSAYTLSEAISSGYFENVEAFDPQLTNGIPLNPLSGKTLSSTFNTGMSVNYNWTTNRTTQIQKNPWQIGSYVKDVISIPLLLTGYTSGNTIVLDFSENMSPDILGSEFEITSTGDSFSLQSISGTDTRRNLINGNNIVYSDVITLNYNSSTNPVYNTEGGLLDSLTNFPILNNQPSPPTIISGHTNTNGNLVTLYFNKNMSLDNITTGFIFYVQGESAISYYPTESFTTISDTIMVMEVDRYTFKITDQISCAFFEGNLYSTDGGHLVNFSEFPIVNNVV